MQPRPRAEVTRALVPNRRYRNPNPPPRERTAPLAASLSPGAGGNYANGAGAGPTRPRPAGIARAWWKGDAGPGPDGGIKVEYGEIPGSAKPVSRLVLGCGPLSLERSERAFALLDAFAAVGGTALDTAHIYGRDGASERVLGQWLAAGGNRERMFVITKGAHHAADFTPRVRPEVIDAELEESLARLGTDHVDLYLLHRDDPAVPVGPLMDCLNAHVRAGRAHALGGSNWAPARLAAANAYAAERGLQGLAASSPFFALAVAHDRPEMRHVILHGDDAALAWYRRTRLPLLSWTSQAEGFFSDRADPDDPEARRRFERYDHPENWARRRRVRDLARRRGCTPTQLALAWVLRQDGLNVFAIIGPGSVEHLGEAVGALEVRLDPDERAWINLER